MTKGLIPNKEEERRRKKKHNLLNLTNDGSKEPQEQDDYSTSSSEKDSWFWASVQVHIQNSEWMNQPEGGTWEGNNQ